MSLTSHRDNTIEYNNIVKQREGYKTGLETGMAESMTQAKGGVAFLFALVYGNHICI